MSTKKKAKGKERKARKAANTKQSNGSKDGWESLARWGEETTTVLCNHGAMFPPKEHVVHKFLDSFAEATSEFSKETGMDLMRFFDQSCNKTYPSVWRDPNQRKMLISILLSMGTNALLIGGRRSDMIRAKVFISTILLLEHFEVKGDFGLAMVSSMQTAKDTTHGEERELLRFFSKRISCSCLKDKYSDAKESQQKMGICDRCQVKLERKSLMLCSRCKSIQYCSVECQHADWSNHKKLCTIFSMHSGNTRDETQVLFKEGLLFMLEERVFQSKENTI